MSDETTMTLDDEMPWRSAFPEEVQSFYDDSGFSFTAETDEYDVMVGNFFYNFQGGPGRPRSQWLADGWVHNDLVVIAPKEHRGRPLANNNFHRTSMNAHSFVPQDALLVTRTDDTVTWQLNDMTMTCQPPRWQVRGTSGGATFDLSLRQIEHEPAVWAYGTREVAGKQTIGGGYCYITGEGTITLGGKTLELRNIAGVHERLAFSTGLNVIEGVKSDSPFGSGIAVHVLEGDVHVWGLGAIEALMFFVTVDGTQHSYIAGTPGVTVEYKPLDTWHDPRSGLLVPTRWQITCDSADGRLDLEVSASARGYYPWDLKHGYQLMYWFLCTANGSFTTPEGRVIPIVNQRAQHELVKVIMAHQETIDGPIIPEIG